MKTLIILTFLGLFGYSFDLTDATQANEEIATEIYPIQAKSLDIVTSESSDRNKCQDKASGCPGWAKWACTNNFYKNWMKKTCPKSCGYCTVSVQCQDSNQYAGNCPGWKWACTTSQYRTFMQKNCKKTCGWCSGSGQTCSNIPTWMKNTINFNMKIVGGMIATSSIPWQVQVRGSGGSFCGGTILDEYTILSAAHCKLTSTTTIVAGATSFNSGSQTIRVKNAINHPNYDSKTLAFDYSIAKLTSALSFNTNVKAACLPTANFVPGNVALASGWGSNKKYAGPISQSLRYVALPLLPGQCSNHLCAGGSDGKGTCAGDSGGPLVVPRSQSDDTAVVIGISSGVTTDADGNCKLSFFASVSAELDWIKTTSGVA